VHLDVVGCQPDRPQTDLPGVTFHGFLDKNAPADLARLRSLFASAHVFFLPTQFEALGIVFAEAASHAVPSVSYRTGGVPSVVVDGITGILLEEGASAAAFADAIETILSDRERYVEMSYAAERFSREHFNWPAWAAAVRAAVENEVREGRLSSPRGTAQREKTHADAPVR
jgi:glycosyltransferase involved in cell wall biosynthesis